jgi:two-component system chemotaxis sensor kinase CheA
MSMDDALQQALLQEFIAESGDALQHIEAGLLHLESHPRDAEQIHTVFRSMHTLKGNCLMLGFSRLEALAHAAENLLENLRNYHVECTGYVLTLLLQVVDRVRSALNYIGRHATEPDADFSSLRAELDAAGADGQAGESEVSPAESKGAPPHEDPVDTSPGSDGGAAEVLDDGFIRLPVKKLDEFLDLLASLNAELGYWRTRIAATAQDAQLEAVSGLGDVGQHMAYLQDAILRYRLEPIGRIWRPYQRLVRDLAVSTGKRVLLVTSGEETEVDRAVLMTIKDPLGHLLRNAIVHGIETPETRRARGKTPLGRVELSASQEHGQIRVMVRDDGGGLDIDRIRAGVGAREFVPAAQLEKMDDSEIAQLIFTPGLSTSAKVDNIAGRGTGLDVVKSAVTDIGGSVQVHTSAGQGCCFELYIPQSMAMVSTLQVRVQHSILVLPQAQVVEVVGLNRADAARYLTTSMGAPAFIFRDACMPLYDLGEVVDPGRAAITEADLSNGALGMNVVVIQHAQRHCALRVDEVVEVADLVIKPLHRCLKHIPILSGGAVLADGRVAFLLDTGGLLSWFDTRGRNNASNP